VLLKSDGISFKKTGLFVEKLPTNTIFECSTPSACGAGIVGDEETRRCQKELRIAREHYRDTNDPRGRRADRSGGIIENVLATC